MLSFDLAPLMDALKGLETKVDRLIKERNTMKDLNPKVYSTTDLCRMFGKSRQTIVRWKKRGLIKPINRLGKEDYYLSKDIDKLLIK
jgi:hypothetical protein